MQHTQFPRDLPRPTPQSSEHRWLTCLTSVLILEHLFLRAATWKELLKLLKGSIEVTAPTLGGEGVSVVLCFMR